MFVEFLFYFDQVDERPTKSVEFPEDDDSETSPLGLLDHILEVRPLSISPGLAFIGEDEGDIPTVLLTLLPAPADLLID